MCSSTYEVQTDEVTETVWAGLLPCFSDSTIHQTWSTGRFQVGEKNLSHLVLREGRDIVALAQVAITKLPLLRCGIATVYWGPLWQRKGRPANCAILDKIIRSLKSEYVDRRGLLLRVWPVAFEGSDSADRIVSVLGQYGFSRNRSIRPYRTLLLNVEDPLDELRKNLSPKWRNQLTNAEKNGMHLIEDNTDQMYLVFLRMLHEMVARKKFSSNVDPNGYRDIQSDLPDSLKMKIIVCAHEKEPVSAAVFSAIGDTGTYFLGATASKGMGLNGSNLVQWRAIERLKELGCRWYDLGGIDPSGNPGVYHFKRGIAGKRGKEVSHLGQFYLATNPASSFLNACVNRLNSTRAQLRSGLKLYGQNVRTSLKW